MYKNVVCEVRRKERHLIVEVQIPLARATPPTGTLITNSNTRVAKLVGLVKKL